MADTQTRGEQRGHVMVLGGGVAGMAAATALVDRGYRVTLLERRGFLGGRAFSFRSTESGWEVDNGQHVFLGCCTAYVGLLRRLGVLDRTSLQDRLSIPIIAGGKAGNLYATSLPAPLHLIPSFLRYPHLGMTEKARLLWGIAQVARTDRVKERDALESETFGLWLRRHGQGDRAIAHFWDLIGLPTLNNRVEDVSADMGLMVFQEGLLRDSHAADMGYARVGLTSLVHDPFLRLMAEGEGTVRFHTSAQGLEMEGEQVAGVRTSQGLLRADAYVSALPFDVLLSVLPPAVAGSAFFRPAWRLRYAPIVGIHVWFDRAVTDLEVAAFLGSEVQWLFNKSRIQRRPAEEGQYLCISLSGAWDYVDQPAEELEQHFVAELRRLLPAAREARVKWALTVKQREATFVPEPGSRSARLPATTPLRNLFLAGDWTDTDWPATMESAARSGQAAAEAAIAWLAGAAAMPRSASTERV